MFRASTQLQRKVALPHCSLVPPPFVGPRLRPSSLVHLPFDAPVASAAVSRLHGDGTAPLREVVEQLKAVAAATRADALSAPSIGYDARVIVLKSGLDTRVLINPEITGESQSVATSWDLDCDTVYRVQRPRSVTVRFTTIDGDDEEWYNLPAAESLAVQRAMDLFDGASSAERLAPCVAVEPDFYAPAVTTGVVSQLAKSVYDAYAGHLSLLVDVKPLQRCPVAQTL